jgi:tripartite-type tricarboxylate transporter receptor subunit TctC
VTPEIPTAREAGYDLIAGTYNLLAAPAGTPRELVEPIAKAVNRVMEKPAIQDKLVQLGITPITNSDPAKARAYVASEIARWTPIVKKLGIAL